MWGGGHRVTHAREGSAHDQFVETRLELLRRVVEAVVQLAPQRRRIRRVRLLRAPETPVPRAPFLLRRRRVEALPCDLDMSVGINFDIEAKDAMSATVAALTTTVKINVNYLVLITS